MYFYLHLMILNVNKNTINSLELNTRERILENATDMIEEKISEHMTRFDQPTRTEVVHLWDVERAGWEGIVLSDETAVGLR